MKPLCHVYTKMTEHPRLVYANYHMGMVRTRIVNNTPLERARNYCTLVYVMHYFGMAHRNITHAVFSTNEKHVWLSKLDDIVVDELLDHSVLAAYRAVPELQGCTNAPHGRAADVWALGGVLRDVLRDTSEVDPNTRLMRLVVDLMCAPLAQRPTMKCVAAVLRLKFDCKYECVYHRHEKDLYKRVKKIMRFIVSSCRLRHEHVLEITRGEI